MHGWNWESSLLSNFFIKKDLIVQIFRKWRENFPICNIIALIFFKMFLVRLHSSFCTGQKFDMGKNRKSSTFLCFWSDETNFEALFWRSLPELEFCHFGKCGKFPKTKIVVWLGGLLVNFIYCMSPFDNKPLKTFLKTWAKNLGLAENVVFHKKILW